MLKKSLRLLSAAFAIVFLFTGTAFAVNGPDHGAHIPDGPDFYFITQPGGTLDPVTGKYDEEILIGFYGTIPNNRVDIPYGVTAIADNVFNGLTDLHEFIYSYTLHKIGKGAVSNCPNLKVLSIDDDITEIDDQAFAGDLNLIYVAWYPTDVKVGKDIFAGCVNLNQIVFWGTKREWDAMNISLPTDDVCVVGEDFVLGPPLHWSQPSTEPSLTIASAPLSSVDRLSIALEKMDSIQNDPTILSGLTAGKTEDQCTTVSTLMGNLCSPAALSLTNAEGSPLTAGAIIATGSRILMGEQDPALAATCVVKGDVLGTGIMSLTQVARAAEAYTGKDPLEGIYAAAADFDGCGSISLTDIVAMANLLMD